MLKVYEELQVAITTLDQYVDHLSGCEIDQTDFCTCGKRQAKQHFIAAIRAAIAPPDNWKDIEAAAFHNAHLHALLTLVNSEHVTREQGLITTILELVKINQDQHRRLVEYASNGIRI